MQIIVLTSNQYVNVLAPFAHFWQQFAGDARPVVVAGYDVAPPELPPRWEFQSIGRQRDYTWSGGLLRLPHLIPPKLAMEMLKGTPYEGGKNWPKITLTHREEGDGPKNAAATAVADSHGASAAGRWWCGFGADASANAAGCCAVAGAG